VDVEDHQKREGEEKGGKFDLSWVKVGGEKRARARPLSVGALETLMTLEEIPPTETVEKINKSFKV